jgi:hypothetical protein
LAGISEEAMSVALGGVGGGLFCDTLGLTFVCRIRPTLRAVLRTEP